MSMRTWLTHSQLSAIHNSFILFYFLPNADALAELQQLCYGYAVSGRYATAGETECKCMHK